MAKYSKKPNRQNIWAYTGRTAGKPKAFGFYALIRLDISSVKEELLRKCKKAERDFEKQQKEWDAYCNEDRPAYEKWMHATFGSHLTELRELHEQVERKSWFVEQVECLSALSGKSPRKLYLELQKTAKDGMSLHDALCEYVNKFNAADDSLGDDDEDFESDDDEDFDKIFEEFEDIFGETKQVRRENPETKNHQTRIRDIYRRLCFKLHPDTGCDFNAENSRLWHQIQEAYQKNDLDCLLAIQASLDMKQDPMASHISCTQILAVIDEFKNGLRSVRSLIRNAQQESSWRFLVWSDKQLKAATRQLEQQMLREQLSLKYEMEYLESIEKKWSLPVKRKFQVQPLTQPKVRAKTKPRTKESSQPPNYSSSPEQYVQPGLFDF
jgi:hypothetical protein